MDRSIRTINFHGNIDKKEGGGGEWTNIKDEYIGYHRWKLGLVSPWGYSVSTLLLFWHCTTINSAIVPFQFCCLPSCWYMELRVRAGRT